MGYETIDPRIIWSANQPLPRSRVAAVCGETPRRLDAARAWRGSVYQRLLVD